MPKPRLLAVSTVPPWPPTNGYALRVYHLLKQLSASWDIALAAPPITDGEANAASELAEISHLAPADLGGRWPSMPSQFDPRYLREAVTRLIAARRPAAALLWHGSEFLAFGARDFPPAVADRIDCLALGTWREAAFWPAWRDRARIWRGALELAWYERRVARALPYTVVVSEDDARVLRRLSWRDTIRVVPNGVELPSARDGAPEAPVPTIAFTGVMDFCPNITAARYFADAVWPLIRRAAPEARFVIAGRAPPPDVLALRERPGVEVLADVPDMQQVLHQAWVVVAPMRCGTGIKNKVLEAWAAAKPVVMTELATGGLRLDATLRSLVANQPDRLAELIVHLLGDPAGRRHLGLAGYRLVAREHSWADAAGALSSLLEAARGAPSRSRPAPRTRSADALPHASRLAQPQSAPPAPVTPWYTTGTGREAARLLLITYHFPPDSAVGGLRWQKLARHAAERGWALDVIALDPAQLVAPDHARLGDLPAGVRIYGVPDARLAIERVALLAYRSAQRWAQRPSGAPPAVRLEARPASVHRSVIRWLPREPRDLLRAYFAWLEFAKGTRWARAAAQAASAVYEPGMHRAIVTCGPPHRAHIAGGLVAARTGLPLIMDMRDPWSLVERIHEAVASPVWLRLARRYERALTARAGLIVMNTVPAAEAMRRAYPDAARRVLTVLNGYDDEPVLPSRHASRFTVAYAGSIYLDRDPRALFRAAARLVADLNLGPDDFGIELMGEVEQFDGMNVARLAQAAGLEAFVRTHAQRPRAQALEFLSRATLLVVLPQDSDLAVPAKVFEYMKFDAWVLAIAAQGSATELVLRGSPADVVPPADAEAIYAALRRRYEQYRAGERPRRIAENHRYSRRAQAATLFDAVEAITASPHRTTQPSRVGAAP